jgi:hypothetical protein
MTTDLQERLREDLANLTSARLDLGIDADALIRTGHRTLRARTVRRAAGGGSLAVAAVLLALAIVPLPGSSAGPVVPAAPAVSAGRTDAAYFVVDGLGLEAGTERLELDVEAVGAGWEVTGIGTRRDGSITKEWSFHQDAAPSAVQLAPKVILEFLPTRVGWSHVVMKDERRASRSDFMHVGALDLTASLVWFDEPTSIKDIAGFIWEEPDGVIRDSLGNTMPTVDVAIGTQTFKVYWDEDLDLLSFQSPGGEVFVDTLGRQGIYPRFLGELHSSSGGGKTTVLGDVLPKGADGLAIELAGGTGEWAQAQLGGRTVYLVTAPSTQSYPIRSISYTQADGNPVSLRMP